MRAIEVRHGRVFLDKQDRTMDRTDLGATLQHVGRAPTSQVTLDPRETFATELGCEHLERPRPAGAAYLVGRRA